MALDAGARQDAVASLVSNLGYRLLMEDLQECVDDVLASMTAADTDEKVKRYGRLFQVFYRFYTVLSTEPQRLRQELTQAQQEIGNLADPLFPPDRAAMLAAIESVAAKPRRPKMQL